MPSTRKKKAEEDESTKRPPRRAPRKKSYGQKRRRDTEEVIAEQPSSKRSRQQQKSNKQKSQEDSSDIESVRSTRSQSKPDRRRLVLSPPPEIKRIHRELSSTEEVPLVKARLVRRKSQDIVGAPPKDDDAAASASPQDDSSVYSPAEEQEASTLRETQGKDEESVSQLDQILAQVQVWVAEAQQRAYVQWQEQVLPRAQVAWTKSSVRPGAWFVILLLLQMFFYNITLHPVLTTVTRSANTMLPVYQRILLHSAAPKFPGTTLIDTSESESMDTTTWQAEIDELVQLRQNVQQAVEQLAVKDIRRLQTAKSQIESTFSRHPLHMAKVRTRVAVERARQVQQGNETLARLRSAIPRQHSDFLMDLSSVPLWDLREGAPRSCGDMSGTLQRHDLEKGKQALAAFVRDQLRALSREESDATQQWVVEQASSMELEYDDANMPPAQTGPSMDMIEAELRRRLEVEAADGTGRIDYASVIYGASVIRTGPRATSKSLVESLPVVNRLLSQMALRFYGYGPEAALTPTYPRHSLGHCFSFTRHESQFSGFGTLSVKLAAPLQEVRTLSIEHVPKEVTDSSMTAIKSFRLFGFEGDDASGKAWSLGSFDFSVYGSFRQQFTVDDSDLDVPPIRSISLAIDSNWGEQYACLYRVRVHGRAMAS